MQYEKSPRNPMSGLIMTYICTCRFCNLRDVEPRVRGNLHNHKLSLQYL